MAYAMVQELSTGSFYAPCDWNARKSLAPNVYPMPPGHCMFADPYGYGRVPVFQGVPKIPAADLARVRQIIVDGMRAYWHVARREHSWREIYPERSDARANAIALARFMADRGLRFPRES